MSTTERRTRDAAHARTKDRLAEHLLALTPPSTVTWAPHPDAGMRRFGWELVTIDGVSLAAAVGDGAVWLWAPHLQPERRRVQEFGLRKGTGGRDAARRVRDAVVNHVALAEDFRARREAARRAQERAYQEHLRVRAKAAVEREATTAEYEEAVDPEGSYLIGGDVHVYVGEQTYDVAGNVYSRGGGVDLTIRLHPRSVAEARAAVDALVSAGLIERGPIERAKRPQGRA